MEALAPREPAGRPLDGMRLAVVVLGDIGRSPRMLYHALACADRGAAVDVIGTAETIVPTVLRGSDRVTVHALPWGGAVDRRPGIGRSALRLLLQGLALFWILAVRLKRPDAILVQTPPPIPALPVTTLAARLRGSRLIADWHNFGWAMLALQTGADHWLVRAMRAAEWRLARGAAASLSVSPVLAERLEREAGLATVTPFYDRPAARFSPTLRGEPPPAALEALFSSRDDGGPLVAVAPSSWTLDEDLDLLLEALAIYDARADAEPLIVLLSGDGPRRLRYEGRLAALRLDRVRVRSVWVPYEDYPRLLAHADIGISLHRSASGVDLPMKVADMLGSGLRICAFASENLADTLTGMEDVWLCSSPRELAATLAAAAAGGPGPSRRMAGFPTWDQEWERVCLPLLAACSRPAVA